MNEFNKKEFDELRKSLNPNAVYRDVTIKYDREGYFRKISSSIGMDRRGEVVFAVLRPNRRLIVVRSRDYPRDIYRVPTGGVGCGENIIEALHREIGEELGLQCKIRDFSGVIHIRFEYKKESADFYSYVFFLDETGGKILEDATEDEVSEYKEVDMEELNQQVFLLENIQGMWSDWGKFRAVTTGFVRDRWRKLETGI